MRDWDSNLDELQNLTTEELKKIFSQKSMEEDCSSKDENILNGYIKVNGLSQGNIQSSSTQKETIVCLNERNERDKKKIMLHSKSCFNHFRNRLQSYLKSMTNDVSDPMYFQLKIDSYFKKQYSNSKSSNIHKVAFLSSSIQDVIDKFFYNEDISTSDKQAFESTMRNQIQYGPKVWNAYIQMKVDESYCDYKRKDRSEKQPPKDFRLLEYFKNKGLILA